MRWEDERYVRVYTRDTVDWQSLSFDAQALLLLLLRKVDRAGLLPLGKHGKRGVAIAIGHAREWERLAPALEELLSDGCVTLTDDGRLFVPNFLAAQEATSSDKARQQKVRELARAVAAAQSVTRRDAVSQGVTECHEPSRAITDGHEPSHAVTPSLTVPSRAETSLAVPTSLPVADAPDAVKVLVTQAPLLPEPVAEKPKRTRKPPEKPTDYRHAPLVQALMDAYAEARGVPYSFRGRDARAVSECLALSDQLPGAAGHAAPGEVLRRWRIALRWRGYPACNGVHELAANWNAYAKPQDASRPVDVTRGGVRAELFDHSRTGTVEDF